MLPGLVRVDRKDWPMFKMPFSCSKYLMLKIEHPEDDVPIERFPCIRKRFWFYFDFQWILYFRKRTKSTDRSWRSWRTCRWYAAVPLANKEKAWKTSSIVFISKSCISDVTKDLEQHVHDDVNGSFFSFVANRCTKTCNEKETEVINDLKVQIKEKQNVFFDMESYLPKKNGWVLVLHSDTYSSTTVVWFWFWGFSTILKLLSAVFRLYLNLVLGNVNVTLLSNQAKWVRCEHVRWAERDFPIHNCWFCFPKQVCVQRRIWEVQTLYDYNTNVWCRHLPLPFQLPVRREISIIDVILWRKLCCWSITCRCHVHRVTDEIFNFLLVWYYCTLTIRESILMSNGSRWVHVHFKVHLVNAVT